MKFVTLTYYRSGSSFFQRLLNNHPDIKAAQELVSGAQFGKFKNINKTLNYFYKNKGVKVGGFKLCYDHIIPEIIEYIKKNDVKIVHFIREDLLETAMFMPGCYSGMTGGGMGPPLLVKGPITLKIDKVISKMEYLLKQMNKYKDMVDFTLTYKEVTGGLPNINFFFNKEVRKELMDFFGVEDRPLKCDVNKKNIRPPNEKVFTNWNEMLEAIEKKGVTRYVKLIQKCS